MEATLGLRPSIGRRDVLFLWRLCFRLGGRLGTSRRFAREQIPRQGCTLDADEGFVAPTRVEMSDTHSSGTHPTPSGSHPTPPAPLMWS